MTTVRAGNFRLAFAGLVAGASGRILAEIPAVVEWHRAVLFPALAPIIQRAFGTTVSTVGEVGALVLVGITLGALFLYRTRGIAILIFVFGLLVFAFYGSWGLAYRYPALSGRLSPLRATAHSKESADRLADLTERSAQLATRAWSPPVSSAGPEADFLARINRGLWEGFARLPASIEVAQVRGTVSGLVKLSRVSFAMSRLQLAGYYFPWTGEAQINAEMPRTLWPRVGAHEEAHQRGFAREDEATVMGVLACLSSRDPVVFYSGALGLFAGFDRELGRVDAEARRQIRASLPRRVVDDLDNEAAFWKAHEGVAGVVSEKVNDTYLKAQGVSSGIASYSETTHLFMQAVETRATGLDLLLQASDAASVLK